MQLVNGDIWSVYEETDLFCITTNSTLKRTGDLVMGAGIALQAAQRFPMLPSALGAAIRMNGCASRFYGLLVSPRWPTAKIAAFQTKIDWRKPSATHFIATSVDQLCAWLADHPTARVDLPFPGIGHGGLTPAQVMPIIARLSDNVHIWTHD
ncbi:MAG: hypothetical protein KDE54_35745 [Caldilineaceae bacterium]|nr:hypothetical protein [Caldilineaceae bacterium]